ncbi:MAG: Veg protein [Firmicutes bacterium]|nr:Veg protein [Bacillota bacterium]
MATKQALAEIRQDLENFVGTRVRLRSYKGRNKVVEREGVLERTYPNIFVIKLDEKRSQRRISFSYTDVLTESVELTVCREGGDVKITAARG